MKFSNYYLRCKMKGNLAMRFLMKGFTTLILLVLFSGFVVLENVGAQIKIMPLGDSITSGKTGGTSPGGYRDNLATLLDNEGVTYDLVGTLSEGTGFDADHEGHDGKTAAYLSANVEDWLAATNPEIVLLHIGTNDIQSEIPIETIRNEINSIITKIHADNPNIFVVLASVIPRKDTYDAQTTSLNALIQESYYNFLAAGYNISYAGLNEVFKSNANWATQYMSSVDAIHPNDTGYEKIADIFYANVMNIINASGEIVTDNFNRLELGPDWNGNPEFQIVNNELANTSTVDGWNYLAIYAAQTNPTEVSFKWGATATAAGIGEGGAAVLLDRTETNANGYLVLIRTNGYINLWTIKNGLPSDEVGYLPGTLAQPGAGDEFKVVMNTDGAGHHFKCFINGQLTGEVTDPEKLAGNSATTYAGVMLRGNLANNIYDFNLHKEGDSTPPETVADLTVISQSTASIMLQWTAPGDDGDQGVASGYEIRYSKGNITESNFDDAILVSNVPAPTTPGTLQTAVVSGLASSSSYFFAMKTRDEVPNVSAISNITSGTTISALQTVDTFERAQLGTNWIADPQLQISSGKLTNVSGGYQWDYVGVFTAKKNPVEAWVQWATTTTVTGIGRGAITFLDGNNPTANGYMVWVRENDDLLSLWTVINGVPEERVINKPWAAGPYTAPGDTFKVAFSRDENGNHFDLYKNRTYISRLSDTRKEHLATGDYYAGVMLHGGVPNAVENFGIATEIGTPSILEYISGSNLSGKVNQLLADSLVVRVTDKDSNPIQGVSVDYSVISGNGALDLEASPDANIRIQAERGVLTPPMQVFTDTDASGGRYIAPPTGDPGDGRAVYQIYIKDAGDYVVWGRVFAPSNDNNSFFFIMDGGEKLTWDLDARQRDWHWDRVSSRGAGTEAKPEFDPVVLKLTAGLHTFTIEEREYRSQIDHIIFTRDRNFVPSGLEEYDEYVTNTNGIAAAKYRFGTTAGPEIIHADVPGLTGSPVQFLLTSLADSPDSLFIVSGNNQSGTGGEALAQPFVVKVTDHFANPVPNIPVTFNVTQGGGSITEPQPQYSNAEGIVSAHYILGSSTSQNLVKVTSDSVPGIQLTFQATATGGIADRLVEVSGNNQSAVVKKQLTAPLVVKVETATGTAVKNYLVRFQVLSGDGTFDGNSLKDTSIRTDVSGRASMNFTMGTLADTSTISAQAEGAQGQLIGSPVIFRAVALPDVPKKLILVSGDGLTGAAGSPLRAPFVVRVVDQYNNPVSGHAVRFQVTAGGGNIDGVTEKTIYTEGTGEAAAYLTLGPTVNVENRVQAHANYNSTPLTNSPVAFKATAGEVTKIEYVAGNLQTGSAGWPLAQSFKAKISDNFGNPVPQYPVDFVVVSGVGSFSGATDTLVFTNFDGIAELTLTLGPTPGSSCSAESRAFKNGVPLGGNPIKFTATAAGLKTLKYITGNNQTGDAAAPLPLPLQVQVLDELGKGIAGPAVRFEVVSGGGVFGTERQVNVPAGENGIAEIVFTLGTAVGDSNHSARATLSYNGSPLQGSPVQFIASARIGQPAQMQVLNNYLTGVVGNALPDPFRVKITDRGGNPISGHPVQFVVKAGNGNLGGQPSQTSSTNADGIAQATLTLGSATGDTNNVVEASSKNAENHLTGSPALLKASAKASAAAQLLLLSGNNQTGTAGLALAEPLAVKVTDTAGNGVEDHPVTFTVMSGGGSLNGAGEKTKVVNTNAQGKASVIFNLSSLASDNNVVQATSTNGAQALTGSPVTFSATGQAGPVSSTHSRIIASPVEVPANGAAAAEITVTLTDAFGNAIKDKQLRLTATGTNNTISPNDVFTNAGGQAVFSLKSTRAEWKVVSASDLSDGIALEKKANVHFTALAAAQIEFHSGNAQVGNIGTAVPNPLAVRVTDRNDNPVEDHPVEFVVTSGGGHLYEVQPVYSDSNGIAQTILVVGTTAGVANTVEARAEGLTNSPIRFMATGVNTPATRIELVSGNDQSAMSGTVLPQPLVVKVVDNEGRAVWNHSVSFQVDLGDGTIDGQSSKLIKTNEFGQASVQFQLSFELGMNIVRAIAEGLSGSPVTFVVNGTSGKAAMIRLVSGDVQQAVIGGSLPQPLIVKITDLNGNGVAGQEVLFSVVRGDATVPDAQPRTSDSRGLASCQLQLGNQAGKVVVEASAGDLIYSPIRFELTSLPNKAAKMEVFRGNDQTGTVGRELVFPFEVRVTDDRNNPVPGVALTFAVIEGSGELLDGQTSVSDSNGIAQKRFRLDPNPGKNQVYAIKSGLQNTPLIFNATGVTNNFPLLESLPNVTLNEGARVGFTVTATDADGEAITFRAQNLPRGANFDSLGTHEFSWTPDLMQAGKYTLRFMAFDPRGGLDVEDVQITVLNMNRAPQLIAKYPAGDAVSAPKHDQINFQVVVNDPDSDPLEYRWYQTFAERTLLVSNKSTYTFVSDEYPAGAYAVKVTISDGTDSLQTSWNMQWTSVELASFSAESELFNGVRLVWKTRLENENAGFNILRANSKTGTFVQMNGSPLPGNETGTYEFVDKEVVSGRTYFYKLEDINLNGIRTQHEPISVTVSQPAEFSLVQNYPNPFNPATRIRYQLPEAAEVRLSIFNLLGQEIKTLVQKSQPAGYYTVVWDGTDHAGAAVASGIYLYRIAAGKHLQTRRMVLLK